MKEGLLDKSSRYSIVGLAFLCMPNTTSLLFKEQK